LDLFHPFFVKIVIPSLLSMSLYRPFLRASRALGRCSSRPVLIMPLQAKIQSRAFASQREVFHDRPFADNVCVADEML